MATVGRPLSMIAEGDNDLLPDSTASLARTYSEQSVTSSSNDEPSPAHSHHHAGGHGHGGHGSGGVTLSDMARSGSSASNMTDVSSDDGFRRIATSDEDSPDPLTHPANTSHHAHAHVYHDTHNSGSNNGSGSGAFRGRQGSDADNYHSVRLSGSTDDFSPFGTHSPSSADGDSNYGRRKSLGDTSRPAATTGGASNTATHGASSSSSSSSSSSRVARQAFVDRDDHEVAARMRGNAHHSDDDDKHAASRSSTHTSGPHSELSKAELLRLLSEKDDQLRSISLRQTAPSPGLPSIYGSSITVPPPLSMQDNYVSSSFPGASSVMASPAATPSSRGTPIRPVSRLGREDSDGAATAAASLANFTRQLPELMSTSLPRVVDFSYSFIPAECINLWQADPGTNELVCRVTRHRALDGVRVPLNGGICGYAAKIGRIVNLSNAGADWRFDPSIDTRPGLPTRSLLMVPVRTRKGQTSAILEAINCTRTDGGFNHDDETIMSVLAGCLSLMTENNEVGEELTLQRKQVEALHQIVDLTSSTALSIGNAIGKITRASHLVCHAERITIYLVDEVNRALVPCGPGVANIPRLSLRDGIAGHVATTGQPANVPDTTKDWRFDSRADRASGFNTRSILAVPIKDHLGKTVAVMEACNRQQIRTPGRGRPAVDVVPFSDDDVKMLISLASTAAGILRQAQLYDEAVSRRKQTEALLQINQLMQTEIGTDKVIPRITESAYKLINAERITLFTLEESPPTRAVGSTSLRHAAVAPPATPTAGGNNLHVGASSFALQSPRAPPPPQSPAASAVTPSRASFRSAITDDPRDRRELVCRVSRKDSLLGLRIKWGDGIVGHVASTLRTLNIPDAYQDSRFNKEVDRKTGFRTRAILTVPITDWEGKCVGVFQAVNKKTGNGVFGPEDEANLTHLATTAGIILRKSKLYEAALSAERKVKALMTVMQVVTNHDAPMQDVIYGILRVAADAINSDRVDIFFVDKDKMFTLAEGGLQIEFPLGFGVAGHCAATGEPVNIANAYDDSHFKAEFDEKLGFRTQSLLCMAVKDDDGKVLAVVRAANRRAEATMTSSTSGPSIIMPDSMEGIDLPQSSSVAPSSGNNNNNLAINTGATPRGSLPGAVRTGAATVSRTPLAPGLSISIDGNGRVHEEPSLPSSAVVPHPSPFIADHEPLGDSSRTDRLFGRGKKADSFTAFTVEDEEILAALCYQIRATIRRYITDAMLEHYERGGQKDDREAGTHSIVSLYSSTPPAVKRNWAMLKRRPDLRRDVSYRWPDSTPKSALSTKLQDASLDNIAFNVWQHTDEDLLSYTVHIFEEMGLVEKFKLPPDLLKNFILAVRKNYDDNPFHNWKHGFSAFHFAYLCLRMTDASNTLQDQDVLGLLVGSLCHDIAHPGLTNTFEIASGSARALIYNDQSVLENHHANTMFSILQQPECNIFAHMKREQRQELRTIMIKAILATDMSFHFDELKRMDAVEAKKLIVPPTSASNAPAKSGAPAKGMPSTAAPNSSTSVGAGGDKKVGDGASLPPSSSFSASSAADRQFVVNMLIHTSDLSGQVFATVIAKEWEERLVREFSVQADKERKLSLPVAPFMQNLNDPYTRAKLQVNFIDFVLVPWWKSMSRIWPGLRSCEKQLRVNREFYSKLATVQESKDKPAAAVAATTTAATATPAAAIAATTVEAKKEGTAVASGSGAVPVSGAPAKVVEPKKES